MRRLLFLFAVLGFSGTLLFFSLTSVPPPALSADLSGIDLSEDVRTEPFLLGSGSESEDSETAFSYLRLSPISGVSFSSGSVLTNSESGTGEVLKIGSGLYFFNLTDIFRNFTVEHSDFRISQIGRGAFFVDTRNTAEIRIFSLSALLDQELLVEGRTVTRVQIFPSTYFGYVPKYNAQLDSADVLRVATVNTLRYADAESETGKDLIFDKDPIAAAFFDANAAFLADRAAAFGKAYETFFRISEKVPESDLSEDFGWYFVNEGKRAALLKGKLLRSVRNVALSEKCSGNDRGCPSAKTVIEALSEVLRTMDETDPDSRKYAEGIIRNAYYLSSFRSMNGTDEHFRERTANTFVSAVTKAFPSVRIENADYALLSEIYSAHYFGIDTPQILDERLHSYVRSLLSAKSIRRQEFLSFSYFLKEYLSREGFEVNARTLDIAYYLVAVSNSYYDTLETDPNRFSALSILFYTYSRIFDRIGRDVDRQFFEITELGRELKPDFVAVSGEAELPSGLALGLSELLRAFETPYFQTQKKLYVANLSSDGGRRPVDALELLAKSLEPLKERIGIFSDYRSYLQKLELNEESRKASGILFEKAWKTESEIKEYFRFFRETDPDNLTIRNDYRTDGFYDIRLPVSGRTFEFKFFPDDGNQIQDLVITDSDGRRDETFKNTVSLDEKKENYRELLSSANAEDTAKREFYQFENFFVNTYLRKRSTETEAFVPDESESPNAASGMSKEMLVFVQRELMEKDFKNIRSSISIGIQNVFAKITQGEYDIDIREASATTNTENSANVLRISGKYLFEAHAFYGLKVDVLSDDGNARLL
jgi:hypothetical protein